MTTDTKLRPSEGAIWSMDTMRVCLWYVVGTADDTACPPLFSTKMRAEVYARERFPDESPSRRYARVMFTTVDDYCDPDFKD